ncbi:hypothetical protein GCM10008090_01080 [Arenicella chitinivorans]|uniref:Uncharacterized protein n=1 Tax=Arenicella chitinivorans TaxID=1329800 RepID=A0A918VHA6_9GAMM|nr:hypothetical protein [Arenicella chitinivorans]GGZ96637.1 hypothetical protein GCM10008090_01080 [Arenicella chitinivorans]
MKLSKYLLSALFSMMAGVGIVKIFMGELHPVALIICMAYLCIVAALNSKGGKLIKYVAYLFAGLLSLLLLGVLLAVAMPLFGAEFELALFFASLLIGAIGVLTIFTIRSENTNSV